MDTVSILKAFSMKETFSFTVFIPLSVSVHIYHFIFIHLPFHNMPVTVAIIPAFPPFLVSSFIVLISAPRSTVSLRHSLFPFFSQTVCNALYPVSPYLFHPPNAFTSHPGKISFSKLPNGNETIIHFWDMSPLSFPWNCPSKASAQALCELPDVAQQVT